MCEVAGIPDIGLALVENIEGTHYWVWKHSSLNQQETFRWHLKQIAGYFQALGVFMTRIITQHKEIY